MNTDENLLMNPATDSDIWNDAMNALLYLTGTETLGASITA